MFPHRSPSHPLVESFARSFRFKFNATDDLRYKGAALVEFPDKRLITNSSSISSLTVINLTYRTIPAEFLPLQLQNLVLENCQLSEVPTPVLDLKSLTLLNLASNSISKLPLELADLPLTSLYVDDNLLTAFPSVVKDMSSLKILSLRSNRLTNVTTEIPSSALTELSLDYNKLTDFAGMIPSLQKLFLRGNSLTTFPSSLTSMTNLLILDLTENAVSSEAIDKAAETITHPRLKELILSSNGLHAVPDLGNLFPALKTLSVHNNSIETVQGKFTGKLEELRAMKNKIKTFTASFSRLTVLDLCENKLDTLPDVASISGVLQSINVSKNGLEKLVDTKPLTTLTSFNVSNNNLTEFDLVIPSLRMLDLCKNKFKTIPKAVWTYNVLDELHLGGNPDLVDVVLEPDQYFFLKRLSVFTMDPTSFKKDCPESWKKELKNITLCVKGGLQDQAVKNGGSRTSAWTYVSLAIGSIAAIALVGFVFVLYRRRREYEYDDYKNGKMSIGSQERTAGLTGTAGSNMLMRSQPNGGIWDDEELQERRVDYDSIKLENKLAAGAYGEVWIGTYRNDSVAVKKLSDSGKRDKTALAYFVGEIKLLAQLDHPRIVAFYGVAWTCMTDLCAVIEFLPGGDLYSLLRTHVLPNTHWNAAKLQIALDIVEALTYVHTLDEILIHRDLKSRNVLLDDDIRAKVTDFGISRYQRDEDTTMTSGMGTGRWMAPEIIAGRGNYNEKVDIYSFGVILSELDTHQMPYALNISNSAETHVPLTEMAILQQVAAGELQPNFSPTCPDAILDVAHKCLAFKAEDRPSALQLAYMLRQLIPMFPQEDAPTRPSSTFSRSTWNRSTNASMPGSTRRGLPVVDRQSSKQVRGSGILLTRSGPGEKAEFSL
jgi:serine/threonine protein kinase/Leucine-rich repeat (LRR) protein